MQINTTSYGIGDASYQAAGGESGIKQLVDDFYNIMESLPKAQEIRAMHPDDLITTRDKLHLFLCAWMGGENQFTEKYGSINIPAAHKHLSIGIDERDAWLCCMKNALKKQPYAEDFKIYLLEKLSFPAEACRTK